MSDFLPVLLLLREREKIYMNYLMGTQIQSWRPENAKVITFVVTQDCNLRCKYCYMTGKQSEHKMTFETAKKAIDYFLKEKNHLFEDDYLILEFIGGEPFLEIDLIDKITDYFKIKIYTENCGWFGKYRIAISTNGILYSSEKVQRFIKKNKKSLSIGISIDGTREKHDLQRVYPDGKGSYDEVSENVKLWKKQFPFATTKVTIGHDDLPYTFESIVHLWNMGIYEVPANVVFEDVWKEGDDIIFEEQLKKLADYIIDNKLWETHNTTLFSDRLLEKLSKNEMKYNFCGTGKAYTIDSDGNIYPCVRYMQYSLNNHNSICMGTLKNGVDKDRVRPFYVLNVANQSDKKCLECEINAECAYCQAANYDFSEKNTNFERATYVCKMQKARCRANSYYWAKLYNKYGIERKPKNTILRGMYKQLYFLLSDDSVIYCNYKNNNSSKNKEITEEILIERLRYARNNFYQPIFVHNKDSKETIYKTSNLELRKELETSDIIHIRPFTEKLSLYNKSRDIIVLNIRDALKLNYILENCILIVENDEIIGLDSTIKELLHKTKRINLKVKYNDKFDLSVYQTVLHNIGEELFTYFMQEDVKEVNVLTDRIFLKEMDNCYAGERNFCLAPDNNLYICPAFYYTGRSCLNFGETGKCLGAESMVNYEKAFVCQKCDAYQCNRCVFENKMKTGEYNVPGELQCKKSHIEREETRKFLEKLKINGRCTNKQIDILDYEEPFDYFVEKAKHKGGIL